jgi:hypothetical protein
LIYEDALLELSVKDAYDELEIVLVWFILSSSRYCIMKKFANNLNSKIIDIA